MFLKFLDCKSLASLAHEKWTVTLIGWSKNVFLIIIIVIIIICKIWVSKVLKAFTKSCQCIKRAASFFWTSIIATSSEVLWASVSVAILRHRRAAGQEVEEVESASLFRGHEVNNNYFPQSCRPPNEHCRNFDLLFVHMHLQVQPLFAHLKVE